MTRIRITKFKKKNTPVDIFGKKEDIFEYEVTGVDNTFSIYNGDEYEMVEKYVISNIEMFNEVFKQ